MRNALQSWSDVADISFTEVFTSGAADFVEKVVNLGAAGSLGLHQVVYDYTTATIETFDTQLEGQFNYNGYGWDGSQFDGGLSVGGLGYITLVHEIGHGLGLDHTHADDGTDPHSFPGVGSNIFTDTGDNDLNQDVFSLMSYVGGVTSKILDGDPGDDNYGFVGGPLAFDIATMQYLYGANTSKNSGNDTYTLSDNNSVGTYFSTIWDTGGTDEIVYNGSKDTTIDLRSATLQNEIGGGGFLSLADGVLGGFTIAGDYTNALTDQGSETGVIIENATGGTGADTITGNSVANVITGEGGNDTIDGGAGNDIINGQDGNDTIIGGAGNDLLSGGTDNDDIDGGSGTDTYDESTDTQGITIDLTAATDQSVGAGTGTDQLVRIENVTTGSGSDTIIGDGAANTLRGNAGADQLFGGSGLDYLYFDASDTVVDGGADLDRAYTSGVIDLSTVGLTGVERVYGANGVDDTLDASALSDNLRLYGLDGVDTLRGGSGSDALDGGTGADKLYGGAGRDVFFADSDDTVVDGGAGLDILYALGTLDLAAIGMTSIERVYGSAAIEEIDGSNSNENLNLYGRDNDDTVRGGSLGDLIEGGNGADKLYGNGGGDAIYFDSDDTVVDGGAGLDRGFATGVVDLSTVGLNDLERIYGIGTSDDTFDGSALAQNIRLYGLSGTDVLRSGSGADALDGGAGVDQLFAGAGLDVLYFDANDTVVDGGADLDKAYALGSGSFDLAAIGLTNIERLYGFSAAEELDGSGLTDELFLYGRGGDDTLRAGSGGSRLDGGTGADKLYGGSGNDNIYIDASDTLIDGGSGGLDKVFFNGDLTITTTLFANIDRFYGAAGNNSFDASAYSDGLSLFGLSGADMLTGGSGNDALRGGGDIDTLIGGLGNDALYGGAGTDVFTINAASWGQDTIHDFEDGVEAVDVAGSGIDLNLFNVTNVNGDAIVDFGGADNITFTGQAGNISVDDFGFLS